MRSLQIGLLVILLFATPLNIQTVYGETASDIKAEVESMIAKVRADDFNYISMQDQKVLNDNLDGAMKKFSGAGLNLAIEIRKYVKQNLNMAIKRAKTIRDSLNKIANQFSNYDQIVREQISREELIKDINEIIANFRNEYLPKANLEGQTKINKFFEVTTGTINKVGLIPLKFQRANLKNEISNWTTQLGGPQTGSQVASAPLSSGQSESQVVNANSASEMKENFDKLYAKYDSLKSNIPNLIRIEYDVHSSVDSCTKQSFSSENREYAKRIYKECMKDLSEGIKKLEAINFLKESKKQNQKKYKKKQSAGVGKGYKHFHFGDSQDEVLAGMQILCPKNCQVFDSKLKACYETPSYPIRSSSRLLDLKDVKFDNATYISLSGLCYEKKKHLTFILKNDSLIKVIMNLGFVGDRSEVIIGKGDVLHKKYSKQLDKKYKLTRQYDPSYPEQYATRVRNDLYSIYENGKIVFGWFGVGLDLIYQDSSGAEKIMKTPEEDNDL